MSSSPDRNTPGAASPAPSAERRQLTVLFCDLVGSTELSARLDPEELREMVRAYQAVSGEAIRRFDGHVAQYLGDGLLVYFGYPVAHEDDAQRAVRAALGIVAAIEELGGKHSGDLSVRVGIHTGSVVVGEMGDHARREHLALGETPNVAARLQALAEPGTVVISGASHKLVQRAFAFRDLGLQSIKGIAAPVRVHRVLGELDRKLHPVATLGPLVGRDSHVALLLDRWEHAARGSGQAVLISGEPGIGKSRLLEAVRERSGGFPHARLEASCSPYHQASPFYAVIQLLSHAADFRPDDRVEVRLRRLEELVASTGADSSDAMPLLVSLLSLPAGRHVLPGWTPQRIKQKTIEQVLHLLKAIAARQPLLMVVEDLHWVDASTLELLGQLVSEAATGAICALFTARPEFSPPWSPRSYTSQLVLDRLRPSDAESIVLSMAGGRALPTEVIRAIVARTDGVPLFLEELTKMMLESPFLRLSEDRYELTAPLPPLAIPMTLQDSLMSRLDRLTTAKSVAQLGAVLGREFSFALLEAVAGTEPVALARELARLAEAEIVFARGAPPDAAYTFKHALIQEAAYHSLLRSERREHHGRAARALEQRFADIATGQPEVVARHYTEAGLAEQAIPFWRRAGENAVRRSANAESIVHFERGLELVRALPATSERTREEFELLVALGPVLQVLRGFAEPEARATFARARALGEELGDTAATFRAMFGEWLVLDTQGALRDAQKVADELLRLARGAEDPALMLQGYHASWPTHFCLGDFALVRNHVEAGHACYDARHPEFGYGGHDAGPCGCDFGALALWALGYPEQARAKIAQGLEWAERLDHPFTLALVLYSAGVLHMLLREESRALHFADSLVALATEHGFSQLLGAGQIERGWVLAVRDGSANRIQEMQRGLQEWQGSQGRYLCTMWWALIAESCWRHGRLEEAATALSEATTLIETSDERCWEAEVARLSGELALARSPSDPAAAESAFLSAIAVARRQEARSWELRAATSLARLWRSQRKHAEARQLLGEVYGWFTEGFETPDLRDARDLLGDLEM